MRIIWWLFLPSIYLLLCVFMMRLLRWAGTHENFESIESRDEYEWTELHTPEAQNEGTAHRARGSYMEDIH